MNETKPATGADLSDLKIDRAGESLSPESPRRSRKPVWIVLVLLAVTGAWAAYRHGGIGVHAVELTTVSLVSPSQSRVVLNASGYVVAQRRAAVASKGTGRLVDLAVREGDRVKKGQMLARLESADVEAALSHARANLNVARSERRRAQAQSHDAALDFERKKSLFEAGLVAQAEYDASRARQEAAQAAVAAAEAGIRAGQAAVRGAEVDLENTRIRAPFDGTVLTKNAEVGEVVAPFGSSAFAKAAVVTMADMDSLQVEADVSESNIQKVKIGQGCEIALDAYPGEKYEGVVDSIVPTADRAKATVMTKIRFVDRDERVLPEMSAKVAFLSGADESDRTEPVIAIHPQALAVREGRKVVYRVSEDLRDRVEEVKVSVGEAVGRLIEVRSGLHPGDRVVLDPPNDLRGGDRIRIGQGR